MSDHSGHRTVILNTIWLRQKLEERLAVNKQRSHRFHMETFNLKKLNEIEGKERFLWRSQIALQLWMLRWIMCLQTDKREYQNFS
jgi:hypothetical protein